MKKKAAVLFLAFLILTGIWAFNNFSLKFTAQTVNTDKLTGELRVSLISDLHGYSFGKNNSKITKGIKKESPDLIFVLGDMYSGRKNDDIPKSLQLITELSKIAPVCVVTGEHDADDEYKNKLMNIENVHLMNYRNKTFAVRGNKINVYGIDNVYFSPTFDLANEFELLDKNSFNLLLSHIPSIASYGEFGFDCVFCGDTHGGMIRLPYLGGFYYNGYLLPKLTYSGTITDKGLYKFEKTDLFVTSGLGSYPLPARFNNRPEIYTITFKGE